ncbi:hypothetical protein [Vibrio sp. 10N.261.46.A3]|uniref:hypothetical protein n=1 Tax=Vibrio sp. 10N.261.46.A3 TaxID=3229658 RepID=UPI00355304B3
MLSLNDLLELNFKTPTLQSFNRVQLDTRHMEKLLEINTNNIPPTPTKINLYADTMIKGEWIYNGDTIRVSKSGVLLDGQNRLMAALKAKMNLTCDLLVGLDEEVFNTIDQGRVRQKGHLVAREITELSGRDAAHLTTAVTKILKYKANLAQSTTGGKDGKFASMFTADRVIEYANRNPEIVEQLKTIKSNFAVHRANLSQSTLLFIYHIGARHDEEYTLKFLKKAVLGLGLKEGETLYIYNQVLNDLKMKKYQWTPTIKDKTLMKVWSSIANKGLYAIKRKAEIQHSKSDDYVQFIKPTEQALIEMKNSL